MFVSNLEVMVLIFDCDLLVILYAVLLYILYTVNPTCITTNAAFAEVSYMPVLTLFSTLLALYNPLQCSSWHEMSAVCAVGSVLRDV